MLTSWPRGGRTTRTLPVMSSFSGQLRDCEEMTPSIEIIAVELFKPAKMPSRATYGNPLS